MQSGTLRLLKLMLLSRTYRIFDKILLTSFKFPEITVENRSYHQGIPKYHSVRWQRKLQKTPYYIG